MLKPTILIVIILLFHQFFINCQQSFEIAKFISEQNEQFKQEINQEFEFPIHSSRNIQQESCVPLTTPVEYCSGLIPNNISYITSRSLNTVEPRLISQIDNFITKMEVNYGSITSNCKNSAIDLYCSMSFKRCVHDRSRGLVELYKPCQYLCQELYLNCIPDRKVAIASSRNDCGDENYPKGAYSVQPTCTDIYFDRDVTSYYIMSFTLLGVGLLSSLMCGGSFLICICCAKSIKPSNSTIGDAYSHQQESDTNSRQSINSGFRFSIDEGKPMFSNSPIINSSINSTNSVGGGVNTTSGNAANTTTTTASGNSNAFGGNDNDGLTVINISGGDNDSN
ncbi:predicted protein [Naegleria gruberi]|uniref:Predicted protein n=1 Tax=Naegleria gruberi TaxID=5762 RepID=D2VYP0_NAEGR|nr:uncharacterized protein NAEGRDRAFT_81731 [Naegleria gruberi]EFC38092.1 predicted protein [Naegleria gruberi]|eukprot:XP_002670836.1 predicted protein [Naegleria gruberi strain NEG-M]